MFIMAKKYYVVYEQGNKLEEVTASKYAEIAVGFNTGFSPISLMVEEAPELSLEEIND